jgi:four helix bundle protein
MSGPISSFTQLRSWQKAREFAVLIYKFTADFPESERYGLISQLQRASVSVAANIAEGFSRRTAKEKINFYAMAMGSLTEVQSHVYVAQSLGFVSEAAAMGIINESVELQKMINGLKKSAKGRIT